MKKIIISGLRLSVFLITFLSLVNVSTAEIIDYTSWAKVLKTYVNDQGRVNYKGLKDNRNNLDAFIQHIETLDTNQLTNADEIKAFWINAYNALTLKTILDNYPTKGIRTIDFGLVWKIPKNIAQKKLSLEHIEHKIVRPMGDPRIHFALNCASIGCPKLPNRPFYPKQLDTQLDYETQRFINDPEKIYLDRESNILYHSELLNWYEDDFLIEVETKLSYIMKYLNKNDRSYIETHPVKLKKIKYDWGLNEQEK